MILTSASVSELSNALTWWERGEYFFSFVVALACFGEYVADFKPRWYGTGDAVRDESRKDSISKRSTLVLVATLVLELVCVATSNTVAGEVIGSISDLATNAAGQANTALDNAGKAQKLAQSASDIAGPAKSKADAAGLKADAVARRAEEIDSDLAATQHLVSARHIDDPNSLIERLKQFKGQGVDFWSYTSDPEAYTMCEELVSLSRAAGMTPEPECSGWTAFGRPETGITVWGPDDNENLLLAQIIGSATHSVATTGLWRGGPPGAPVPRSMHPLNPIVFVGSKTLFVIGETAQTRDAEKKTAAMKKTRSVAAKP